MAGRDQFYAAKGPMALRFTGQVGETAKARDV